jgi:hypothetical protein
LENNQPIKVFVSYSHADSAWLKRLQVHLKPLQREYDIDIWDDTRITPGSRWRDEIRKAVDEANVAILIISADFLASDFIVTNELPPLLKAAEEEGALILPIIASASLFNRNQQLSQFQTINSPSKPLVKLSDGEQEEVFLKVAEAILNKVETKQPEHEPPSKGKIGTDGENFLDHSVWTRLVKIGDWILDENKREIIGAGKQAYLLSRREYGQVPFSIETKLRFSNFKEHLQHSANKMNAGVVFGWKSEKENPRYYHLMLTGEELLLERIGFQGGNVFRDYEHLTDRVPLQVQEGVVYHIRVDIGEKINMFIDDQQILSVNRPTGVAGRVGLRPWRSQINCMRFTVKRKD